MFGWKKKSAKPAAAAPSEDGPIIAVLLVEDQYDLPALREAMASREVFGQPFTDLSGGDKGVLSAVLGDEIVAIAPMPAPYPWTDLEGPCHTSWLWPKGQSAMDVKGHKTHVLVTVSGGSSSRVRRRAMTTQITAMAASQPGVIGVYWAEATLVHHPGLFIQMAEEMDSPDVPLLYLWVDFRLHPADGGKVGMFTTGLAALGLMEIEIPRIDMQPGELREWGVNIGYYLLDGGKPIPDGDTLGVSETHQMRVRHVPSSVGHEGLVMRIEEA